MEVDNKRLMIGEPLTSDLEELLEKYQSIRIDPITKAELQMPIESLIEQAAEIEQGLVASGDL